MVCLQSIMHVVDTKALFRGQGEASPLASKFSGANTLYQRTQSQSSHLPMPSLIALHSLSAQELLLIQWP